MGLGLMRRLERAHEQALEKNQPVLRWATGAARGLAAIFRHLTQESCLSSAAALSFTTILSLVPLLAVSFALFQAFTPAEDVGQAVRRGLVKTFLADSVSEVVEFLEAFLTRANSGTVGLVGLLFLLVTAISLFMSVERTFNRIWGVPASRPLHRRLTTFYAVITLSPTLIALAFFMARKVEGQLASFHVGAALSATMVSWLLEVSALSLLSKTLPHTRIAWRAALGAGIAAAIAFEVSKWGFNLYIREIYKASAAAKIYGSFALIPVFFLWVYLTWIIVLAGVVVTYVLQNRGHGDDWLVLRQRTGSGRRRVPTGYLTARIFFEVARHFRACGGGASPESIADQLRISTDEVMRTLEVLRSEGLLLLVEDEEAGLRMVPAKPLEKVRLIDLMRLPEAGGYAAGELPLDDEARPLEALLRSAQEGMAEHLDRSVSSLFDLAESR